MQTVLGQTQTVASRDPLADGAVGEFPADDAADEEAGARGEVEEPGDQRGGEVEAWVEDGAGGREDGVLEGGEEAACYVLSPSVLLSALFDGKRGFG